MRTDQERIADTQRAAEMISDYLGGSTEAAFLSDRTTIDAAFFNVIVIGEAVNSLLAPRKSLKQASDKPRRPKDCAIVEEYPDIEWLAWVEMRNLVTHQYFRRQASIVWSDFVDGGFARLQEACAEYLQKQHPGPRR